MGFETTAPAFWEGFSSAFIMILITEFGDNTFILAGIMAASASRSAIFLGNMSAMVLMTLVSAGLGLSVFMLLSPWVVHLITAGCFLSFAVWCCYSAGKSWEDGSDSSSDEELRDALVSPERQSQSWFRAWWQSFVVTMVAEWGDRSQLGTITLATSVDLVALVLGCLAGLAVMTGLSVVVGKALATCLKKRTILLASGVLFLLFGALSIMDVYEDSQIETQTGIIK